MQFSAGDYIALGMFSLAGLGIIAREMRARLTRASANATSDANTESIIAFLRARLDTVDASVRETEEKRQLHELKCAGLNARIASSLERVTERLDAHDRTISHLQAQISHVATGAAGRIVEIGGASG